MIQSPLHLSLRLQDARLPVERPLALRVLRVSWGFDLGRFRAAGVRLLPLSVIDRSAGSVKRTPILDPFVMVAAATIALSLGKALAGRSQRGNRTPYEGYQEEARGE